MGGESETEGGSIGGVGMEWGLGVGASTKEKEVETEAERECCDMEAAVEGGSGGVWLVGAAESGETRLMKTGGGGDVRSMGLLVEVTANGSWCAGVGREVPWEEAEGPAPEVPGGPGGVGCCSDSGVLAKARGVASALGSGGAAAGEACKRPVSPNWNAL